MRIPSLPSTGIWFTAFGNEPDPRACKILPPPARCFVVPPDRATDPDTLLHTFTQAIGDDPCYILVPGQAFDQNGNRRGRGGGWYDRFLSRAPRAWLRIGVCPLSLLQETPMTPHPWDEPMDALLVQMPNQRWRWIKIRTAPSSQES